MLFQTPLGVSLLYSCMNLAGVQQMEVKIFFCSSVSPSL
jgi:hypothetical protein